MRSVLSQNYKFDRMNRNYRMKKEFVFILSILLILSYKSVL